MGNAETTLRDALGRIEERLNTLATDSERDELEEKLARTEDKIWNLKHQQEVIEEEIEELDGMRYEIETRLSKLSDEAMMPTTSKRNESASETRKGGLSSI